MATMRKLPNTAIYLQAPATVLESDLGEWRSDALIAWGSDKYIFLKESRISSNDGDRIDAYVLDQYGEILDFYEGISEGTSGVYADWIQAGGIENGKLYFSYETNGSSGQKLKIASLDLADFKSEHIFEHGNYHYGGSAHQGVSTIRLNHQFVLLGDGSAYLAANSHNASTNNLIKVNLDTGTFQNITNLDFYIDGLVKTDSGFAALGVGHLSHSYGGKANDWLHLQFFDGSGTPISHEILYPADNRHDYHSYQNSLISLKNGDVVIAYSNQSSKYVKVKIYPNEVITSIGDEEVWLGYNSQLVKEYVFDRDNTTYGTTYGEITRWPELFATADGGFILSFRYTYEKYLATGYHNEQVFLRFDKMGNPVPDSFRTVSDEYGGVSTLATDQDGGLIGVSWDESGIKSTAFLAQLFGTTGDDEISGSNAVNTIFTFDGDDVINALDGNDYIDAGPGANEIFGGSGNDHVWLEAGSNNVDGGEGTDWLLFADDHSISLDLSLTTDQNQGEFSAKISNMENIDASELADFLSGSEKANWFLGRAGNDIINGRSGDDRLNGGSGDDSLTGGPGSDEFVFSDVFGHDTIEDYNQDEDKLVFDAGVSIPSFIESANESGFRVLSSEDSYSSITFNGVQAIFSYTSNVKDRLGRPMRNFELKVNRGEDYLEVDSRSDGLIEWNALPGINISFSAKYAYTNATKAITSADALDALKLSVGLDPSGGEGAQYDFIAADFNQDGQLTSRDALEILKYVVGFEVGNKPKWIFLESETDLSAIDENTIEFKDSIFIPNIKEKAPIDLTGILLGDVNDSFAGFIA